ncbi:MAG: tetratricopeptide repeat-containing sensor histidine kinase, partial [Bacteroidota bacterium]
MKKLIIGLGLFFCMGMYILPAQQVMIDSLSRQLRENPRIDTFRVKLLVQLGKAYAQVAPSETRKFANEAIVLSQSLDYLNGEGAGHQVLGISYAVQGNYAKALQAYIIALDLRGQAHDTLGMAQNLANIAGIYYSQRDYQKAETYSLQGLALMEQRNDTLGLANTYHALGLITLEMDQLQRARKYLEKSIDYHEHISETSTYSSGILQAVGDIYERQGNPQQAMVFYDRAVEKAKLVGDHRTTINASLHKSNLLKKEFRYIDAYTVLNEIEPLAQQMDLRRELVTIYYQKNQIDSLRGNYASALTQYQNYIAYKDKIRKDNQSENLEELRIKFETEQREKENELLRRDQVLKEAELAAQQTTIRNQRLLTIGAVMVVILFLLVAAFLYRTNLQTKEVNQALSKSKDEIKEQKEELEFLNQTKDKWFAMICHDFKQPLAFMQGALGLLTESDLSTAERKMILSEMESRVRNTSLLLDNLLFWAQDQMQGIVVRKEKIDLPQLIEESLILLEPIAQREQIDIQRRFAPNHLVWADLSMVQLVVNNLIASSIKLTHADETITITTEVQENVLVTHIANSGHPIPESYLSKLFEFDNQRVAEGIAREQGMGINLLISKDFIEKNGGKIWVRTHENETNVISFALPHGELPRMETHSQQAPDT